jgi:flagellar protein FlbT
MPPEDARTPARRIYFALQTAYIGTAEERQAGLDAARHYIAEFQAATTSQLACSILDRALAAAETDQGYQALRLARRIIRHEDAVLGTPSLSAPEPEMPVGAAIIHATKIAEACP